MSPPPALDKEDWVDLGAGAGDTCWSPGNAMAVQLCTNVSPGLARQRVVVVGDSHTQQFAGAVLDTARERRWQVISVLRGACPFSTASETVPASRGCLEWNAAALEEIVRLRPDAVITTATRDARVGLTEKTPPGFVAAWRRLERAGIPVLALRDSPRFATPPKACLERRGATAEQCAVPRKSVLAPVAPYRHLADLPHNVVFLDTSDYLCTPTTCPPVVGNVLVYFDDNHITATFARTLAPAVAEQLVPMVER